MNTLWHDQLRSVRLPLGTATVFILAWLILPRASFLVGWRNTATGGAFSIASLHGFCAVPTVRAATVAGSRQAQDCAQASHWFMFFTFLLLCGIALLCVAAYKIYRQYRAWDSLSAPPWVPEQPEAPAESQSYAQRIQQYSSGPSDQPASGEEEFTPHT